MRARAEQMAKMLLAKDHHVIEAVPPDRSHQPLGESIIKSSQLHLFRSIERKPSRSLMSSIPYGKKLKPQQEREVIPRWRSLISYLLLPRTVKKSKR
jgi:hypothetical protein